MGVVSSDKARRTTNGSSPFRQSLSDLVRQGLSDLVRQALSEHWCCCLKIAEDSSCKEEKVENIFFKSEKVLKTKVAYFYTPSTKTMTLTETSTSNRLPSG